MKDPAVRLAHESALRSIARVVEEKVQPTDPAVACEEITQLLATGDVMVLTGAGVSTDSGVPDYRGPRGSLSRHRPMTYQEFRYDPNALHRYWARSFVGWRHVAAAQPNEIHKRIARWQRRGYIRGVVTQNVDGLHQAAGSTGVIALHGDLSTVVCLECGHRERRKAFDVRLEEANPDYLTQIHVKPSLVNPDGDVALEDHDVKKFQLIGCQKCASVLLKPDVVYFGEPVPRARKEEATKLLEESKALLVLGSSLAVMSGMRLVLDARKRGMKVAVINGGPGRADDRVDILWRTQLAPAFMAIEQKLELGMQ